MALRNETTDTVPTTAPARAASAPFAAPAKPVTPAPVGDVRRLDADSRTALHPAKPATP